MSSVSGTVFLIFISFILSIGRCAVRPCFKYDDGYNIRCIKEVSGYNGDNFGRVGIINKSQCSSIRFMKQEWTFPCEDENNKNAKLQRISAGEALKYGDFQQEMVQDHIQPGTCGEIKILECHCGRHHVKCGDVLWVATYKRGEHIHLLEKFKNSQQKENYQQDAEWLYQQSHLTTD